GSVDMMLLTVAIVVGALLRLVRLGAVGLNSDEAVYAAQAASLAGNPHFTGVFPVFRAHPLLFQILISPLYRTGTPDVPGRYVDAAFGVGTIVLVFMLGRLLYGRRVGALAALLLGLMPYHVIITRQLLLDGPMTFFATGALVCLAILARSERSRWLIAAGACLGLAALTKETAIVMVGSAFVFLSLVPRFWRPVRYAVAASGVALGLAITYPLVTAAAGGSRSGQSYLLWQLSRRPNHDVGFYLTTVPLSMGPLLLVAAAAGLLLLRQHFSWREVLLLSWVVVPFVFFQIWPVKGFPYLLLLAPPVAVLAARCLGWLSDRQPRTWLITTVATTTIIGVAVSLLVPSLRSALHPSTSGLAGAGGSPGGREAGLWIAGHLPQGAQLMTLGPSMGNIVQYYSGHRADALSVSPNPLRRNPAYRPIPNPDAALRAGTYQYVVWDAYSARRSPTFATRELGLIRKFDGRAVHTELASLDGKAPQPVIVIYLVHP
ncbi:MAG: ArnT family glycosyltransferase, partial [Actinomycetes bacterium]